MVIRIITDPPLTPSKPKIPEKKREEKKRKNKGYIKLMERYITSPDSLVFVLL